MDKTTDIHTEQPPQAQTLTGARARMLAKALAQKNGHTEVQARIIAEAGAQNFLLRVWVCLEAGVHIFLVKVQV